MSCDAIVAYLRLGDADESHVGGRFLVVELRRVASLNFALEIEVDQRLSCLIEDSTRSEEV